jgi:hypothetical protein
MANDHYFLKFILEVEQFRERQISSNQKSPARAPIGDFLDRLFSILASLFVDNPHVVIFCLAQMIWQLRYYEDRRKSLKLPPSTKLTGLIQQKDKKFIQRKETFEGLITNIETMFGKIKDLTKKDSSLRSFKLSDLIGPKKLIPHDNILAFPSHATMYPSRNDPNANPPLMTSPKGDPYIRVFTSKEKPFKVSILCSDGLTRDLIFKHVTNENIDAFLPRYFINELKGTCFSQGLPHEYPDLYQDSILVHNVFPLCKEMLVIECIPNSRSFIEYTKQDACIELAKQNYLRNIMEDFAFQGYLQVFDFVQRIQISHAVWCAYGFLIGIGDRNLANIMIQSSGCSFYIDYELIMGIGNNLPVPEVVDMRLGFAFRSLFGPCEYEGLFHRTLASALGHISKNMDIVTCLFYELTLHKPEATFMGLLNPRLTEASISDFFARKHESIKQDSAFAAERLIERNSDKSRLDVMFQGWNAQL